MTKSGSTIYWLGGSTCAGKTTISNMLSNEYGFTVYHCDEYFGKHIEKSNALEHPNLYKLKSINWNEILSMTTKEYLDWTVSVFKEEFEMILEDLRKLSDDKRILAEGVDLLPELVKNEISDSNHAVWLVADEFFYKEHQMQRKELFDRVKECSNPEQALNNYMCFDLAFGKYIVEDAGRNGLNVMEVKKESNLTENIELIFKYFGIKSKPDIE